MNGFRLIREAVLLLLIFLSACSDAGRNHTDRYVSGVWEFEVNDNSFTGTDTLVLAPDSTLREYKNLFYSSSDSGFAFSVAVSVEINGRWGLCGDSLNVTYDPSSLRVSAERETFHITATEDNADTARLTGIRDGMYDDLAGYLTGMFQSEYERLLDKKITLGRVDHVDSDNLLLVSGDVKLLLSRCR